MDRMTLSQGFPPPSDSVLASLQQLPEPQQCGVLSGELRLIHFEICISKYR